jgi:hypothetical protein
MATARKNSMDEEFDVYVSSYTDDDDENDDDDSCGNETEDDDIRLSADHHRHESPSSTAKSRNVELRHESVSSANTKKFSIASILGTEGDDHAISEFENKGGLDGAGTFVRPTPVSAMVRPPPLTAATAVALYPSAFFAHQNSYSGPASSSAGFMLEMISPNSVSPNNEHALPYSYPASLASASAASLLYGGWFTASTANKAPSQLFGLQGKAVLCINTSRYSSTLYQHFKVKQYFVSTLQGKAVLCINTSR